MATSTVCWHVHCAGYGLCAMFVNNDSFVDVLATSRGGVGALYIFYLDARFQMLSVLKLSDSSGWPCPMVSGVFPLAAGNALGSAMLPVGDWDGDGFNGEETACASFWLRACDWHCCVASSVGHDS